MRHLLAVTALTIGVAASAPTIAAAQVSTVDEGSFTIFQAGAKLGHEDFRIRRMPVSDTAAEYVATAIVAYPGRRLRPNLRTGTRGGPLAYTLESNTGALLDERVSGQTGRGRFSAVRKTPDGESTKEYALSDGAVILDDEVFSQYYFLGQSGRAPTFAVLCPRCSSQTTVRLDDRGADRVRIGSTLVDARHLVLHDPSGRDREVWVDERGRVLQVAIPSRELLAVRDEVPRS